jgi:hypothetical protein
MFELSLGARRRKEHDMGENRTRREGSPVTILLAPHTEGLRKLSEFPTELALPRAAAFLARLVKDPDFVESQILPLLGEARGREDWYVACRYDANDGSYSLKGEVRRDKERSRAGRRARRARATQGGRGCTA